MVEELLENKFIKDVNEIKGVGHRIVHGGEKYSKSAIITDDVINDIDWREGKSMSFFFAFSNKGGSLWLLFSL